MWTHFENDNPTPMLLRAIHQSERLFRRKYQSSRLIKNVKSSSISKNLNCGVKLCQSTCSKSSKASLNKTKTVDGSPRKPSLQNRSSSGAIIQVARFKSFTDNRFNQSTREKELNKSLKDSESKNSRQTFIDQEARSYAKLIANYSRAMETYSFHNRSFQGSFGRTNIMLPNSPLETVIASFSKIKKSKEAIIGSNLSTRNCSTPSPKYHTVHGLQKKNDRNGSRSSFHNIDSGEHKEWLKKVDVVLKDLQNSKIKNDKKSLKNITKLDEKDILHNVKQRADWLDKVVKAFNTLKTSEINNNITSDMEEEKITVDLGKKQFENRNISKKMRFEDLIPDSFMQEHTPCPIELCFVPIIDTLECPVEIETSFKKGNRIEKSDMKTKLKMGNIIEESLNFDFNELSENAAKIEIRIPITSSLTENKTKNGHAEEIQTSTSTLKLQISLKIKEKHAVNKDENKSHFKYNKAKSEAVKEIKILLNSADNQASINNLENSGTTRVLNKAVVRWNQTGSENGSQKKDLNTLDTKSEKAVKDFPLENLKAVKVHENKDEVDDNLTKKASLRTCLDLHMNRSKSRRRRKGTTVISRVIENELKKQNEKIIVKDKKVTTTLTTETKKNNSVTEALKPEAERTNQNTRTIDKVRKKIDELIDQNVETKLSDSVTGKAQKSVELQVNKAKTVPTASNISEKINKSSLDMSKIGLSKSPSVDGANSITFKTSNFLTKPLSVTKALVKTKMENKDIPNELKAIEKKKDGTLIDYGLKVLSRKSKAKDFRKLNSTECKDKITTTIQEITPKKEESLTAVEEKNDGLKSSSNAVQLTSVKEQLVEPQKKSEFIDIFSKFSQKENSQTKKGKNNATILETSLQLKEFEENHIFSGPDRHPQAKDSQVQVFS